jgi:hypothetical protein
VATGDLVYFQTVSEAYKRITGIESVPVHRTPQGAFFQYGYFQFGVPSFSTPGWGISTPESGGEAGTRQGGGGESPPQVAAGRAAGAGGRTPPAGAMAARALGMAGGQAAGASRPGTGNDALILSALEEMGVQAFVDWSTYQHPELGEVEIGGFVPYATQNPPADRIPELGEKHGEFLVELAGMLAHARIADTEVTAHGGGVFTVEVEVENAGLFPTSLQHGQTSRSVGPTLLQIQVDPEDILTGADKTTSLGRLNGSGTRESVTWVIQGRTGAQVEIKLRSQKAGTDSATVTLR